MISCEDYIGNYETALIRKESKFIDKKEWSEKIIMLCLQILEDKHQFTPQQMNKVIISNNLHKKGWEECLFT